MFRFTNRDLQPLFMKNKCVMGRWATRLPARDWDLTGAPLLKWATPPPHMLLPGMAEKYFEFISVDQILESVCVLPKPRPVNGSVYGDDGDINCDDRSAWVHTNGHSALGESG